MSLLQCSLHPQLSRDFFKVYSFSICSMNAVGEMYRKTTKQLELEKRRNKLAEMLSKETALLEVCSYNITMIIFCLLLVKLLVLFLPSDYSYMHLYHVPRMQNIAMAHQR